MNRYDSAGRRLVLVLEEQPLERLRRRHRDPTARDGFAERVFAERVFTALHQGPGQVP